MSTFEQVGRCDCGHYVPGSKAYEIEVSGKVREVLCQECAVKNGWVKQEEVKV